MNKTQAEALEGSIEKWERIVEGTGADVGIKNCTLCHYFQDDGDCVDCPVAESGEGRAGCSNTPYDEFVEHWNVHHGQAARMSLIDVESWPGRKVLCDECRKLAQAELEFLKSLRQA